MAHPLEEKPHKQDVAKSEQINPIPAKAALYRFQHVTHDTDSLLSLPKKNPHYNYTSHFQVHPLLINKPRHTHTHKH